MSKPARSIAQLDDFPGLVTAVDPGDLPPGAAVVQTNVTSESAGELNTRRGYIAVGFEEE